MSSLGSRAGFSSSFRMSVSVISPMPSSSAKRFLSPMRRAREDAIAPPFAAAPGSAAPGAWSLPERFPPEPAFPSASAGTWAMPPMAAANALPIAVLVLETRMFPFRLCFFWPPPACAAFPEAFPSPARAPCPASALPPPAEVSFRSAAFFCICLTSSIVSPSFSSSFMAAS